MIELIPLMGYVFCVITAMVAFQLWRKAQSFYVLLEESAQRIDQLQAQLKHQERESHKVIDKLQLQKDQAIKAEKTLQYAKTSADEELKALHARAQDFEEKATSFQLKFEHYKSQVEVLTRQLKESDEEIKEVQTRLSHLQSKQQENIDKIRQKLEVELQMEREQRKSASVDTQALAEVKRKIHHVESLYRAMRGQREMAEERNRNWETALRKLSLWVLEQKKRPVQPDKLGPMVGQALECIGARLVEDEFESRGSV